MIICTCDKCKYTFRYPLLPPACPDCGTKAVRPANEQEKKEYRKNQRILAKEIRSGLYAAAG